MVGPSEKFTAPSANITAWLTATSEAAIKEPVSWQNKEIVGAQLDALHLPHPATARLSAEDALALTSIPTTITSDYIVWHMLPHDPKDKRYVQLRIPKKDALTSLRQDIYQLSDRTRYDVLLSDYFENEYGGQFVITPSGQLFVEFGKGFQGNYAAGHSVPTHTVKSDPFSRILTHSYEDVELREAIWKTVRGVYGNGRNPVAGYYEFALYRTPTGSLAPIFFDARTDTTAFNTLPR
ncbi:MAG: hypothetical protein WAQ24_05595 [Candidatus Saccharimonadales bacterium]